MSSPALHIAPRRLVLVDIENLAGCSPRTMRADDIHRLSLAVQRHLPIRRDDVVIVAANPAWEFALRGPWRGAVLLFQGGPDGADLALCDQARRLDLGRAAGVVIGSGDGRFTEIAQQAVRAGVPLTVFALPHVTSRRLRDVAERAGCFQPFGVRTAR